MRIGIIFITLLGSAVIVGAFLHIKKTLPPPAETLISEIQKCAVNGAKNICFQKLAVTFLKNYSKTALFETIQSRETNPLVFQYCHQILHFAGRDEYGRSKNIGRSLGDGSPLCFAGFYHGALEEYLHDNSDQEIDFVVQSICQRKYFKVPQEYNECLHGLGHALLFFWEGEVPRALVSCDMFADKNEREWCYSGVFMENSTSSTNKDHPPKYLRNDDPLYPCSVLQPKYLEMCYTLQGFYMAEAAKYDWEKTVDLCKTVPENYQKNCFNAFGQTQVGFTQELLKMKTNCDLVIQDKKGYCLDGVIGALGERYPQDLKKMFDFCALTEEGKTRCFANAFSIIKNRVSDKKEFLNLCSNITEVLYRSQCEKYHL